MFQQKQEVPHRISGMSGANPPWIENKRPRSLKIQNTSQTLILNPQMKEIYHINNNDKYKINK